MSKFEFTVSVECDTAEQADTVMCERIEPDEDYGFDYYVEVIDGPVLVTDSYVAVEAE